MGCVLLQWGVYFKFFSMGRTVPGVRWVRSCQEEGSAMDALVS